MDWDTITDKLSTLGESVGLGFKRVLGSKNERVVRRLDPIIQKINALEPWAQGLDQDGIRAEIVRYKEQVQAGEKTLEDLMPEVFALVREASQRTLGMRHFDVQLVGGYVLHEGSIAEMTTGEGKTLVATLALSLNALTGRPCYLVTVNDYLARRDADWMRPIYEYLGLSVGSIQAEMGPAERQPVYASDIIYSTNNECGFDYLRDNMKTGLEQQVQKDLYFAIVDEVDSILIDEARTPLIISGPAEEHIGKYQKADEIARKLEIDVHYEVKEKEKQASLLEEGIVLAQELAGVESFYTPGHEDWPHYIENALRAHEIYHLDKEYVVEVVDDPRSRGDGPEVIIVDEFTGRKMVGRRWSDGLHQAIEVKEGLDPKQETQTLATITFQNYFRMFEKLSGMTGTALTEAGEFHKIYALDVVSIPTNLPLVRDDGNDIVYRTEKEKWRAIVDEIERIHTKGQPVLVGTTSVEKSEHLSKMLGRCWCDAYPDPEDEEKTVEHRRGKGECHATKIPHEILNAKNHEREAHIIACAGERGAVTVSTNMAGRGTDIKLGGNFEYRLGNALEEAGLVLGDTEHLAEIDVIRDRLREQCESDEQEVLGFGGLYVLGTERHEARRIDNQLRGRSGRQGNAGESRFFLSLQDDLMRIFYRDWVTNAMEKLGMTEGQPIESGMVSRAIARAQKKVEDRNFEIRKSLLEYDEVMDFQRKTIYGVRQEVLEKKGTKTRVLAMMVAEIDRSAEAHRDDAKGYAEWCLKQFAFELEESLAEEAVDKEGSTERVVEAITARYDEREQELGEELMRKVEAYLLLNAIDSKWKDHLHALDALKAGIGLRGYGQVDPKVEYKREGQMLFEDHLFPSIEDEVASLVMRIQVRRPEAPPEGAGGRLEGGGDAGLVPRGMGSGSGTMQQPTPAQVRAYQAHVRQVQARRAMGARIPASSAFDVMKRQKSLAASQGQKSGGAPAAAARPAPAGGAAQTTRTAPASKVESAFAGAARNAPCPCGSGKKFKKCHGA